MARNTDKLRGGFDVGETGGALSGLLAEDEELDRHALWRLGTWGAASVGAVIVALLATQSSIGIRRDQSASVDILKQAQQLQLSAKDSQNETRRLASAIDTLNGDRDRLYSRVAVLEQGLDSVTGAIARGPASSPSQPSTSQPGQGNAGQGNSAQGNSSQGNSGQASANQSNAAQSSANPTSSPTSSNQPNVSQASVSPGTATATGSTGPSSPAAATSAPPAASAASNTPATTAAVEPQASAAKPSPLPFRRPRGGGCVGHSACHDGKGRSLEKAVAEKQDKPVSPAASSEPGTRSATAQQGGTAHPPGSLVASKSMMGPPDPAAGKLIESAALPKIVSPPPLPEVAAVTPKAPEEADAPASASSAPAPELVASRTEFGVDVGSANSIAGLRALWRGLQKSHSNAALAKLRPIIVIKENNTGLGMQLRLVAGPINDAAAAAKICASLTVSDRGCTTAVFEGQRLALGRRRDRQSRNDQARSHQARARRQGGVERFPIGIAPALLSGEAT